MLHRNRSYAIIGAALALGLIAGGTTAAAIPESVQPAPAAPKCAPGDKQLTKDTMLYKRSVTRKKYGSEIDDLKSDRTIKAGTCFKLTGASDKGKWKKLDKGWEKATDPHGGQTPQAKDDDMAFDEVDVDDSASLDQDEEDYFEDEQW